jgi:hypothetical protein
MCPSPVLCRRLHNHVGLALYDDPASSAQMISDNPPRFFFFFVKPNTSAVTRMNF